MEAIARIARRLSLRDLRIVAAVARTGSMGKAAVELSISQPVVSKAVTELEQELGLILFDRTPSGVQPTIYGETLVNCSAMVFDDIQQGLKELEHLADPTAGELNIGCTEPLAAGFVPQVIECLSRSYPRIIFNVTPADSIALRTRDLRQRTIDLAVALTSQAEADIDVRPLFDDPFVVLAGSESPWIRRREVALKDLIQERWVLPPAGAATIAAAFVEIGLEPPRPHVSSYSVPLHQYLLETGNVLTMLPLSMLRFGKNISGKPLRVKLPSIPRPVGILTLKNRTIGPIARKFIEVAQDLAVRILK
jgi:DNA-binding transcriptional LysR family regulator